MLTENIRSKLIDLMAAQESVRKSLVNNLAPYDTQRSAHDSYHEMRSNVLMCLECGLAEADVVARIDHYIDRLKKMTGNKKGRAA